jgi:hypothetical protein
VPHTSRAVTYQLPQGTTRSDFVLTPAAIAAALPASMGADEPAMPPSIFMYGRRSPEVGALALPTLSAAIVAPDPGVTATPAMCLSLAYG